jgi:hypothetical protein
VNVDIPEGALDWLARGERGISSEAIFSKMTGVPVSSDRHYDWSIPLDPSDLRRCRLLLEAVPEWQSRLHEMTDVSTGWAEMVKVWPELCATLDEEVPHWRRGNGTAPCTYRMMREAEARATNRPRRTG